MVERVQGLGEGLEWSWQIHDASVVGVLPVQGIFYGFGVGKTIALDHHQMNNSVVLLDKLTMERVCSQEKG